MGEEMDDEVIYEELDHFFTFLLTLCKESKVNANLIQIFRIKNCRVK